MAAWKPRSPRQLSGSVNVAGFTSAEAPDLRRHGSKGTKHLMHRARESYPGSKPGASLTYV